MNVEQLIEHIQKHPYMIRQGAKKTAKYTKSDIADVRIARRRIQEGNLISITNSTSKVPKILIFDIETAPMQSYVWGLWKQNIHIDHIINEWFVICWSAKWLYSNEVLGDVITPDEILKQDDKRVVTSLWKLFDEADIIVAHNGDRFDIPRMKTRFIINGLKPPSPYRSIDTCLVARKQFGFSSNKLDALATYFGFDHKLDTDFELWKKCLEGDQEALDYMLLYNNRDVTLLEEVYLKLRPWIQNHPNIGNYLDSDKPICSNCGSTDLTLIDNRYYYTQVGKYPLYRCQCGCITRGRKSLSSKPQLTSISR